MTRIVTSIDGEISFREALSRTGRFSEEEIRGLFDYAPYLAHVDVLFARVGIPIRVEVTR